MEAQTQADRLAVVESILKDAYGSIKVYKEERDNPPYQLRRSSYDALTGKIRGIAEVLDAFAEAGFEVRND